MFPGYCVHEGVSMSTLCRLLQREQKNKPKTLHYHTELLCLICELLPLYGAVTPVKCVRLSIGCKHANGAGAARGGDMSIYNLENSHLIVFDRRSPRINNGRGRPHMSTRTRTGEKATRTQTHMFSFYL